jgi:hypothetical protein
MPLLGFLAVKQLIESDDKAANRKAILIAGGITAAVCLIVAAASGAIDTSSSYDTRLHRYVDDRMFPDFYNAVLAQRQALISSSALRSLVFVLLGTAITWVYCSRKETKNSTVLLAAALGIVTLIDMVPVDRKFFGDRDFVTRKEKSRYLTCRTGRRPYFRTNHLITAFSTCHLTPSTMPEHPTGSNHWEVTLPQRCAVIRISSTLIS